MTERLPREQDKESGAALIMVMGIGAMAMILVFGTTARLVSEAREVDDYLVQVRAYWAAMGMVDYVLSRSMASGACTNQCNTGQIQKTENGYVTELKSVMPWMYPDVSAAYQIGLSLTATADSTTSNLYEYVLRVTFIACDGFGPAGNVPPCPSAPATAGPTKPQAEKPNMLPALRTLDATRPVEVRYCFITAPGGACGTGATLGLPGYHAITSVHRPSQ